MENSQYLSATSADTIMLAAQSLHQGNLVAFPTETVYGLGADASNVDAVAKIYKVKGRPADHPLIVHVHSMQTMEPWISEIPSYAISLGHDFWPGPMTLILKRSAMAKNFVTGGQESVGIRIPNHPVALSLLEEFYKLGGNGIAAPSANRFGHVSPTSSEAVLSELHPYLGDSDLVLDGGQSIIGLESTIIDCTSSLPRILRPGKITFSEISESTKLDLSEYPTKRSFEDVRVSGNMDRHYSPEARILLDQDPLPGQGFIAMNNYQTPVGVIRLMSPTDSDEFAHQLYSALREADEIGLSEIVIIQPTDFGISIAIRDRLKRASLGRMNID